MGETRGHVPSLRPRCNGRNGNPAHLQMHPNAPPVPSWHFSLACIGPRVCVGVTRRHAVIGAGRGQATRAPDCTAGRPARQDGAREASSKGRVPRRRGRQRKEQTPMTGERSPYVPVDTPARTGPLAPRLAPPTALCATGSRLRVFSDEFSIAS